MGQYVNNGKVTITQPYDYDDVVAELALLIGVGKRDDGRYHLADVYRSPAVNAWSKNGPFGDTAYNYPSDEARDAARVPRMYSSRSALANNILVSMWSWYRSTIPTDNPARLLDFKGYNHYAQSGVLIKNTATDPITLETNPDTGDNITMADVMPLEEFVDTYQWILVDPFGFVHTLASYSTRAAILEYLYGSSTKLTVSINDYQDSRWNYYEAIPAYPYIDGKWTLGLSARDSEGYWEIMNPVQFTDLRIPNTIVRCIGFTPNMNWGTAAAGQKKLYNHLYGSDGPMECCTDDFLFLGVVIQNIGTSIISFSKLRVLMVTNVNSITPHMTQLGRYNQLLNSDLAIGGSAGTGGGLGTAWANGMCYIRTNGIWNLGGGTTDFAGFMAIAYVESASKVTLLTPYIRIGLRNNGISYADLDTPSATLPEVKPVPGWTTTI